MRTDQGIGISLYLCSEIIVSSAQNEVACSSREKCGVCNPHFHKFSADFRSKRYGIGKEKGRATADSTLTGFFAKSNHSGIYHFLGRVRVPVTSTTRSLLVSSLV